MYYHDLQPGNKFTPMLWTRKTINAVWEIFLMIWTCQNGEKSGKDYDKE
jgi:hypothetical protein